MNTVCQCNKEKKRNTHLRVKEASWNISPLLSYLRNAEFSPPSLHPASNRAGGFGTWRLNWAFSPRVKVARFRRRAGGGGGGGSLGALWRAFPQTQELVFWWFLRSYLTSAPFSCWYFLLLKQRICIVFLSNFFILREAATAERRYKKERWSENYMHMAAFSTRTYLLLPLSSFPPLSHSPLQMWYKGSRPARHFRPPPQTPHRGLGTDFGNLAQSRRWPPFWRLWVW
jgi:hypothetical protein